MGESATKRRMCCLLCWVMTRRSTLSKEESGKMRENVIVLLRGQREEGGSHCSHRTGLHVSEGPRKAYFLAEARLGARPASLSLLCLY